MLLLEVGITQVIKCQAIFLAALVLGQFQISAQVLAGLGILFQSIIGFSSPIIGIRLGSRIVLTYFQRTVEILQCLCKLSIGKCLCTQTEKNLLLGFHDTRTRLRNLGNGLQGCIVTTGIHVSFHQVIVHTFTVSGIREFIQETFENNDRFCKRRIRSLMDAQSIIVQSLFLNRLVIIADRSLFESHTSLVAILQLEISQTHVQVGILCQCILHHGGTSQHLRSLGVRTGVIVTHTQFIHSLALWSIHGIHISLQRRNGIQIVLQSITGFTLDTLHFRFILMSRKMTEVIRSHIVCLLVFATKQMNLAYIIRYESIIYTVVLQWSESLQGSIISPFHIVYVTQVVYSIRLMSPTHILQQGKPNLCLFQIAYLQVRGSQFQGSLISFLVCQGIQIARTIESNRFLILPFFKIHGSHHRLYPIGMSGIRILFQISLQQFDAVFRFQFIFFTDTGILLVARYIFR